MASKDLLYTRTNCYHVWDKKKVIKAFNFAEQYKSFLTKVKTERLAVIEGIAVLEKNGFVALDKVKKEKNMAGKKVYMVYRDKTIIACVFGKRPVTEGMHLIVSHIDSPRIDLKANPLYEDAELALLKTQYYGGIKKYQWPTIPLAMHGVVILKNGKKVAIHIGENETDPVFMISDLLPHVATKQMEKRASDFIAGEELNIIVGSIPVEDKKEKLRLKQAVVEYLNKEYGMIEEDFQSAEIEMVPAGKAYDIGFDRSLMGGYGHDDRSASFCGIQALMGMKNVPEKTALIFWCDKEEIGSFGATGAQSNLLFHAVSKLVSLEMGGVSDMVVRDVLMHSSALSADVDAGYDADYKDVHDERNTAKLNHGIVIVKYTGGRGKYGANDADAEYVGTIRKIFNDNHVIWQNGTITKVDGGGGGTIAYMLAAYGISILDCGPAVLCMHAPFEILAKADLYATYEAYSTFFEKMQ